MRLLVLKSLGLWCLLTMALSEEPPASGEVRLVTPHGTLTPVSKWFGVSPSHVDGKVLLSIREAEVIGTDVSTGKVVWRAREPDGRALNPLLVHDHHLLVGRLPTRKKRNGENHWDFTGCGEVLRLNTTTGKWANSLPAAIDPADPLLVSAVTAHNDLVMVSRHRWGLQEKSFNPDVQTHLRVAVIANGRERWAREWPCDQPIPQPGATKLTGPTAAATLDAVVPCTVWGDALLICPGTTSPIYCVAAVDGKERWSVERIWEFERDFVGPSVWCHVIRRFGRDLHEEAYRRAGTKTYNVTKEDEALVKAQMPLVLADWRTAFDQEHRAWITGGPWLVDRPIERGERPPPAILMAVAIAPRHSPFARNLARVRLIDIGTRDGDVVAIGDLPRMLSSDLVQPIPGHLAFATNPDGIGTIRPFPYSAARGGMGGGPDCLLPLAWYREPVSPPADAWLQGRWKPRVSFGADFALQPRDCGFVRNAADTVLSATVDRIALVDGSTEHWRLDIGMRNPAKLPESNYSGFTRSDGTPGRIASGLPAEDSPTSFRVLGGHLLITLGMPNDKSGESTHVAFTLPTAP